MKKSLHRQKQLAAVANDDLPEFSSRTPPKHNESKLQRECVRWFRLQYPHLRKVFFAIPNGGKRNAREAAFMQGEGVVSGVADLLLAIPRHDFHGLFIEMKYGKNQLTEHQIDFKTQVQKHGYRFATCYTFDHFQREMEFYVGKVQTFLAPPRTIGEPPRAYRTVPQPNIPCRD